MARIDDYNQAFELGKKGLSDKAPDLLAQYSGCEIEGDAAGKPQLILGFLNRPIVISWPDLDFKYRNSAEDLQIQQKVLLVHYLSGAWASKGAPLTGKWIAYQEVPDGRFYLDAFLKRAKNPLLKGFGEHPELLEELAARTFGAEPSDHGDVSVVIRVLPLVPMVLLLWKGDEEFPPEGNILFDRNIPRLFSAEDIAWLAGMAVYPLIALAMAKG
jgi:hypothetical protein